MGTMNRPNRHEAADRLLKASRYPTCEYTRCVLASIAYACRWGTVFGPFFGSTDLRGREIRAALQACAQDESDAADVTYGSAQRERGHTAWAAITTQINHIESWGLDE